VNDGGGLDIARRSVTSQNGLPEVHRLVDRNEWVKDVSAVVDAVPLVQLKYSSKFIVKNYTKKRITKNLYDF